ncbi:hypothetical protein [Companilactobacillus nuruki]|uniref:Uncharacterized protein n=1 Tax=Companilactobacillus nuruki TaxID=1993540 RepID=A0A2N7AWD2_9LACO|nr:hypothetical protein [Companilactobacillus nuruki]PMD73049.1 hypothetical protein CBP76_02640 [Companilactobacillus nuruki]
MVFVLSSLTNNNLNAWNQVDQWSKAYGKFGPVGKAKLDLITTLNKFETGAINLNKFRKEQNVIVGFSFIPEYDFSSLDLHTIRYSLSQPDYRAAFPSTIKELDSVDCFSKMGILNENFVNTCYDRISKITDIVQFNEQQFIFINTVQILKEILKKSKQKAINQPYFYYI